MNEKSVSETVETMLRSTVNGVEAGRKTLAPPAAAPLTPVVADAGKSSLRESSNWRVVEPSSFTRLRTLAGTSKRKPAGTARDTPSSGAHVPEGSVETTSGRALLLRLSEYDA